MGKIDRENPLANQTKKMKLHEFAKEDARLSCLRLNTLLRELIAWTQNAQSPDMAEVSALHLQNIDLLILMDRDKSLLLPEEGKKRLYDLSRALSQLIKSKEFWESLPETPESQESPQANQSVSWTKSKTELYESLKNISSKLFIHFLDAEPREPVQNKHIRRGKD